MRALDPEVENAVWEAVEALLPEREVNHPMGGHRRRIPDRVCFRGVLVRLVTGCSWVSAERLLGGAVSGTTLRARRDEWTDAGARPARRGVDLPALDGAPGSRGPLRSWPGRVLHRITNGMVEPPSLRARCRSLRSSSIRRIQGWCTPSREPEIGR